MADVKNNIKAKKEFAKLLYTRENLSQKETSERSGVSAKTINKWVNEENWDALRANITISKAMELRRIYAQINEINTVIEGREEGHRYANSKEADTLSKLAATAKSLESELSLSEAIAVFMQFGDFVRKMDVAFAKQLTEYQDKFITFKLG